MVEGDRTPCTVLGGAWVVAPIADYAVALRLEDASGVLWPSAEERVAELEAELARRSAK